MPGPEAETVSEPGPSVRGRPLDGMPFGAEVLGVDLGAPMDDATFARVRALWLEHQVIVFKDVEMAPGRQIEFSRRFGEIELIYLQDSTPEGYPELFVISTIPRIDGTVGVPRVGRHWHTDSQFLARPVSATILYAKVVPPEGGDTEFINMYEVYDTLPDDTKARIQGLKVVYDRARHVAIEHPDWPEMTEDEKARMPPVAHPLVRTHPETGRKALYLSAMKGLMVEGWPEDEGRTLIDELMDFAGQPRFVNAYHWEVGDVVIWDSRCLLHRSTDFDTTRYQRHLLRTAVEGDVPV